MSSSPIDAPATPAKPLNVGAILLALAVLWAVPVAWGGYKWYAPTRPTGESAEKADPDSPEAKAAAAVGDVNRVNYIVTVIVGALGGIGCLVGALWWISSKTTMEAEDHARLGRILILLVGGFTGMLLMFGGVWFFIDQYELLSRWLTKKEIKSKELWKILVPALVFIVGAGAAFLAAQPARQEERNDQTTRRLVYGTNFLVTAVLLFLALLVVNGFVGLRLPNRLDTTQTGYYSVSASTENYVKTLTEKVTVYSFLDTRATASGGPEADSMMLALQELNPSMFVYRKVGATANTKEIQELRGKFAGVDFRDLALIVAVGDTESRYSFIRDSELIKSEPTEPGQPPRRFFEGESRFVRELLFLAEGKSKTIVYFTQGNGELAIAPAGGQPTPRDRSANELKAFLEKANLDVRPMPFDAKAPTIPADAAMVIVADPLMPLPKELVGALTKYMNEAGPGGKKGKLIVLSGPQASPKGDVVQPTGLEELLKGFNIGLTPAHLLNVPMDERQPPEVVTVHTPPDLPDAAKGAVSSVQVYRSFQFLNARPVELLQTNPAVQTTVVIETPGGNAVTWQETEPVRDSIKSLQQLQILFKNNERAVLAKKKLSPMPVPVAAVATEGTTARVVAIGTGDMFSDETAQSMRRENPVFKLAIGSIDWLRDRPSVEIANKQFGFYTPQAKMDQMRLLLMPFGLSVLVIAGLAAGVWVIRRK